MITLPVRRKIETKMVTCHYFFDTAFYINTGGAVKNTEHLDPALSMEPDTILTFYSWASGSEKAFTEAMIRQYEKENKGIKIEANFVLKPDYLSKISILNAEENVGCIPASGVKCISMGQKGVLLE